MSGFKGTPGPWRLRNRLTSIDVDIPAEGPYDTITDIQDIHDARLIAAAPELLEALQLLMAEQTGGNKSCGHNGFTCMCPYDKAHAAITKALGEPQ